MEIYSSDQGGVMVLVARGRIDSMSAAKLGQALSEQISGNVSHLVLDLAGVDYMSSAGLRELVNALKKVKRIGGDLRLSQPTRRVREVMEMAGLDTIFLIFETSVDAVESY